jgi:hypothetical protein
LFLATVRPNGPGDRSPGLSRRRCPGSTGATVMRPEGPREPVVIDR